MKTFDVPLGDAVTADEVVPRPDETAGMYARGVPIQRDPARMLERIKAARDPHSDLWVFGYASLIWRPEFHADEQRLARLWGFHRSFTMRSRINRGSPAAPGLVFALLPGGSCAGMAYRISSHRAETELARLWEREMPTGVYDPRWLRCATPKGPVTALAFTLSRASPNYTGEIRDEQMLHILRTARGRFGTTLDYLLQTECGLRRHGIHDREIARLAELARRHGLA